MRHHRSKLEIPPRPQSDTVTAAIADLREARDTLAAYEVKIPANSRIDQALAVLEHAERTGALVPAHRKDDLGLRALELAFDYSAIASTLPATVVASVRRELRDSLQGTLDGQSHNGRPIQLQSQYIARAALVRGGLIPLHPTHSTQGGRKSPDLYVENGIAIYAIEAKRPRQPKNIVPRFDDAKDQLGDYPDGGAVIMDVTDCVRGLDPEAIDDAVDQIAAQLSALVIDTGYGYRPGYKSLRLAGVVARAGWASVDGPTEALIQVHTSTFFTAYGKVANTIGHRHGKWLRKHLGAGYDQLYRTIGEVGQ